MYVSAVRRFIVALVTSGFLPRKYFTRKATTARMVGLSSTPVTGSPTPR